MMVIVGLMTMDGAIVGPGMGEAFTLVAHRTRRPVLLAAPHSGRLYPDTLMRASRLPLPQLRRLEDPFVDRLLAPTARQGHSVIAARYARAWVDLNRGEGDLDPAMLDTPSPRKKASARALSGLGLFPRLVGNQPVLRQPMRVDEAEARIAAVYRPYHGMIESLLGEQFSQYGMAILLDCHSMPSLTRSRYADAAEIVLGDLHGGSTAPWVIGMVEEACLSAGYRVARNQPYAGGHTLERHGAPDRGIHALQIEVDRALYMDVTKHAPHAGFDAIAALFARIAASLAQEVLARGTAHDIAAE